MNAGWAAQRLAPFDLETDGPQPEDARIITATILNVGGGQDSVDWPWLLRTERPIPAEATAVHGITTERADAEGIDRRQGIGEIRDHLLEIVLAGTPVVIFNAAYDLTVLDRECRRVSVPTLSELLEAQGRELGPILDPHVIDKAADKFRKGKRTLGATCQVYGIDLGNAHDATADALGAARLAYKLAVRFPQIGSADLWDLHRWQVKWRAEQQEYWLRQGKDGDPSWPLRPWSPC